MKSLYRISFMLLGALGLGMAIPAGADAQGPIEAYRFGLKGLHGTARAQALGGAVGALGADPTAVYVNPAGLGLYSRSTISISADPGWGKSMVNWQKSHQNEVAYSPGGFNNVSYMTPFYDSSSGTKFSMGVSYNRDYDFDRAYRMTTGVLGAGLADLMMLIGMDEGISFNKYIDGSTPGYNPFKNMVHPLVAMGANADLIRPFSDNDKLFRHAFLDTYNETTKKWDLLPPDMTMLDVVENGARNSVDINMSMGFGDIFYVGAALRLGTVSHARSTKYREDFKFINRKSNAEVNNHMILGNELTTSGNSIGLNLGAMVMLGDYVRLGLSYMTPERISMEETYSARMVTYNEFIEPKNKRELTFQTALYDNSYILRTPGQLTASALVFLGQYGFVSYDFQYRDLATAKLYAGDRTLNPLTEVIKEDYGKEMTHKFGIEVRPIQRLALRGGMSFTGNPMKGEEFDVEPANGLSRDAVAVGMMPDFTLPRSYQAFSFGVGYRISKVVSIDLAYARSTRTEQVYPFSGYRNKQNHLGLPNIEIKGARMEDVRNNLVATLTLAF